MIQNIVKVVLAGVIVFLGYVLYTNIMKPVKFNEEVDKRSKEVVQNLKDIRAAQLTYRSIHSSYTGSFDSLIDFVRNGKIAVVKMVPDPTDTTFTRTIRDTLGFVGVQDSLFKRAGFDPSELKEIPFSHGKIFELNAGKIEKGGVKVNVFEVRASYDSFLSDLDKQLLSNLNSSKLDIEKFPGLKVGSMEEVSTDGNWE
jgi:hypothetical protein